MRTEIRHNPGFAIVRCFIGEGEEIKAESGAMAAMGPGVELEAKMEGGFLKALKRSALSGDSFFVTTYKSTYAGGWVDVAAHLPGDAIVIDVTPDRGLAVTRGGWLANDPSVAMDSKWGGTNNLFGGEGGFVARFTGQGSVVVGAYGAIDEHVLGPDDWMTIDSGHIVAYDDGLGMQAVTAGGFMNAMKSGEGFVVIVRGPGRMWTQTRNPSALVEWLTTVLPFTRA